MDKVLLYPMVSQATLVFGVLALLARRRIKAITSGEAELKYYRLFTGAGEPDHVAVVQRSYHNQLEMPVLFFAACLAATVFEHVDNVMVGAAWAYVILRYVHAWVHITKNRVQTRFRVFVLSNIVLAFMWVWLVL